MTVTDTDFDEDGLPFGDIGWCPTVTADEFAQEYADESSMPLADLIGYGRAVRPCNCRQEGCRGWVMVNAEDYDADVLAWFHGEAPHPGRLTSQEWAEWLSALTVND